MTEVLAPVFAQVETIADQLAAIEKQWSQDGYLDVRLEALGANLAELGDRLDENETAVGNAYAKEEVDAALSALFARLRRRTFILAGTM